MTVAAVVRVVPGAVECVVSRNKPPGGDTRHLHPLPEPEHHVATHVGEVEVEGSVLVQVDAESARVTTSDCVAVRLRPVSQHSLTLTH